MWNEAYNVVDNACTFPMGDCMGLLSDAYLQWNNGARVALVNDVLEEPQKKKRLSLVICLYAKDLIRHPRYDFAIFC